MTWKKKNRACLRVSCQGANLGRAKYFFKSRDCCSFPWTFCSCSSFMRLFSVLHVCPTIISSTSLLKREKASPCLLLPVGMVSSITMCTGLSFSLLADSLCLKGYLHTEVVHLDWTYLCTETLRDSTAVHTVLPLQQPKYPLKLK